MIDADYVVDPRWLRDLVPAFATERTGVVQAPQDYRDAGESAFKAMCHAEYRGFFHIGMVTRNERNAIIQHGTMTLVRRTLLERIGWAEWCITEDAELGLRIFEQGYEATYIPESYGRGVMPDNFLDFKKQRSRWAFGAMQILRRHFDLLIRGRGAKVTGGQRYHFVAGWLPWLADGLNLLFNCAALVWSLVMVAFPAPHRAAARDLLRAADVAVRVQAREDGPPLPHARGRQSPADDRGRHRGTLPVAHDRLGHGRGLHPHATGRSSARRSVRAGMRSARRSPRRARRPCSCSGLWFAAWAVSRIPTFDGDLPGLVGSPDLSVWVAVLLIQSIPYAAAVIVSLVSALDLPGAWIGEAGAARSEPEIEPEESLALEKRAA